MHPLVIAAILFVNYSLLLAFEITSRCLRTFDETCAGILWNIVIIILVVGAVITILYFCYRQWTLRLIRDKSIFSRDATFENTNGPIEFDTSHSYVGSVLGELKITIHSSTLNCFNFEDILQPLVYRISVNSSIVIREPSLIDFTILRLFFPRLLPLQRHSLSTFAYNIRYGRSNTAFFIVQY